MSDDWVDNWEGQVDNIGPSPYSFNGKLPQQAPQMNQQGGAGTLAGLAAALMKYNGNSGGQVYNSPQYGQDDPGWQNGYGTNGGQMPSYLPPPED